MEDEPVDHGCGDDVVAEDFRSTRLVDLVNTLDPKLVAATLGLDPQAPLIYLADRIDPSLLPTFDAGPSAPARTER